MKEIKINPNYKEIATKCLFEDTSISRKDIQSLNLFNSNYIDKLLEMDELEIKIKLLDIITRQAIVTIK